MTSTAACERMALVILHQFPLVSNGPTKMSHYEHKLLQIAQTSATLQQKVIYFACEIYGCPHQYPK